MLKLWPGQQGLPWGRYLPTLLPAGMKVLPCNAANTPVAWSRDACSNAHLVYLVSGGDRGGTYLSPNPCPVCVLSHAHITLTIQIQDDVTDTCGLLCSCAGSCAVLVPATQRCNTGGDRRRQG